MARIQRVVMDESRMYAAESMRPVLEAFARKIKGRIFVSNPHQTHRPPYEGEEFDLHIYFWCLPPWVASRSYFLSTLYRERLEGGQGDGFRLLDRNTLSPGTVILDQLENEVALIVGKTLYVLFDLPHKDGPQTIKILEMVLADYYLYLTDIKEFEKEMGRRKDMSVREKFLDIYKEALNGTDDFGGIKDFEEEILELRKKLSLVVRDRRVALEKKKNPSSDGKTIEDEKIEAIFDRLCKLSTTGKISISGDEISIPVGQIDIEYDDVIHDIGEFEVIIDLEENTVSCVNKTRVIDMCFHPHVGDNGECCLGDASYGIGVLLGELELETVVLMMIEFLNSYSPDGAIPGAQIEEWPIKEKK